MPEKRSGVDDDAAVDAAATEPVATTVFSEAAVFAAAELLDVDGDLPAEEALAVPFAEAFSEAVLEAADVFPADDDFTVDAGFAAVLETVFVLAVEEVFLPAPVRAVPAGLVVAEVFSAAVLEDVPVLVASEDLGPVVDLLPVVERVPVEDLVVVFLVPFFDDPFSLFEL